jgi:hypothetical protein
LIPPSTEGNLRLREARAMVDSDRSEPIRSEADAQDEATIMPWLWGACGLVLIAVFVAWVLAVAPRGHSIRQPAAAAPLTRPINQHF